MVLHQRPYRETSLLVEVLSSSHGRIAAVAKGAKRGQGGRFSQLRAFRLLDIGWTGRGELKNLTHAEPRDGGYDLSGRRLLSGFYLNELLLRFLPRNDAHADLFTAYSDTVAGLSRDADPEPLLRVFEKRLLEILGYGLDLVHDAETGEAVEPGRYYIIEPERGPISGAEADTDDLRVSGESLLQLHAGVLRSERSLREAKRLMRALIGRHLGSRELNSRSLFRTMR